MKKVNAFFPNEQKEAEMILSDDRVNNQRDCPSCGFLSLQGMPGGRDSVCQNCGYKDPCCYD